MLNFIRNLFTVAPMPEPSHIYTPSEISQLRATLETNLNASCQTSDNRAFAIVNAVYKLSEVCLQEQTGMTFICGDKTIELKYDKKRHKVKWVGLVGWGN